MRIQPQQQGDRIYNPAKGTVVESRNVTFLETPAYTLPPDVTTEDYHYEEDVLRFTSVLDSLLTIGVERVVLRSRLVVQFYSDEL